jgi:fructose/tagatose bisphosphate aldolase
MTRCIIVHGIDDARTAAAAARSLGVGVRLASAPGAASHAGAAWFAEIAALVKAEYPDVPIDATLDCGDAPGHAMAALRAGVTSIRFTGPRRVREKIAAIAKGHGARLDDLDGPALDISLCRHAAKDCRNWLAET